MTFCCSVFCKPLSDGAILKIVDRLKTKYYQANLNKFNIYPIIIQYSSSSIDPKNVSSIKSILCIYKNSDETRDDGYPRLMLLKTKYPSLSRQFTEVEVQVSALQITELEFFGGEKSINSKEEIEKIMARIEEGSLAQTFISKSFTQLRQQVNNVLPVESNYAFVPVSLAGVIVNPKREFQMGTSSDISESLKQIQQKLNADRS